MNTSSTLCCMDAELPCLDAELPCMDAELQPTGRSHEKKVGYINKGRQIIRVFQGGKAGRMKTVRRVL